jgi:hypothetical protein
MAKPLGRTYCVDTYCVDHGSHVAEIGEANLTHDAVLA